MDQRLVRFFILASVAFLLTTLLQPLLFPKRQNPNQPNTVAKNQDGAGAETGKPDDEADQETKPDAAKGDPTAAEQTEGETAPDEQQPTDDDAPLAPPREVHPNRLVQLGKYGSQNADKLVATFNTRGATIHRIELNARTKKGALRYKDLDRTTAYVGQLELTDEAAGCRVNCVTPGTPAEVAGIQNGDLITHCDGEPVVSTDDFVRLLNLHRPGDTIDMGLSRGSMDSLQALNVSVIAEHKPLQVLGPDSGMRYEPDAAKPESMLITLRKKTAGEWPELDEAMRLADWQVTMATREGQPVVEFSLDLPASPPEAELAHGPLRVIKRYWLPASTANSDLKPNFHVLMELEIQNRADSPQALAFEIMGPTGTNIEGWWYQNKIHGRSSAVFHIAGARDIVSSNSHRPFYFWGGPEIVKNFLSDSPRLQEVFAANVAPETKLMRYIGVDTQYFATALLPHTGEHPPVPDPATGFRPYSAFTHVVDSRSSISRNNRLQRTTDLTFRLFSDQLELAPAGAGAEVDATASYRRQFEVFAGPKETQLLTEYGLRDLISFGWFAWVSRPLLGFLQLLYGIFGNYGIAIILLTVFVRLIIFPISRRAQMNAARHAKMMQFMQPEIKKLQERYKDNLEKRARAQNELFKRYNYSPLSMFGGCFLMFLQLPIFIGLYRGLSVDIALRGQPLIPGVQWCSNLAGPDQFLFWKDWLPFGLSQEQGLFGPYLNILPLVTVALFVVQTKLFSPPATDDQQKMAQRVMTLTMAFMGVLFFKVPSGLCIYFITSSLWGILERQFIPKPQLPPSFAELQDAKEPATGDAVAERASASPASLSNEKERESRRKIDRERQRRLRESK